MTRTLLAAVAATLCFSAPALAETAGSGAPLAPTAPASGDSAQPAAATPAKPEKPKKICKPAADVTGSRLGTGRVCMSQAEWDATKKKPSGHD